MADNCVSCSRSLTLVQDVQSFAVSGDLGFYASLANGCVDTCPVNPVCLSSGRSALEAFSSLVGCCARGGGGGYSNMGRLSRAHQILVVTNLPKQEFPTNQVPDTCNDIETSGMVCRAQSKSGKLESDDSLENNCQAVLVCVAANAGFWATLPTDSGAGPLASRGNLEDKYRADLPLQFSLDIFSSVIISSNLVFDPVFLLCPSSVVGEHWLAWGTQRGCRPLSSTGPGSPGNDVTAPGQHDMTCGDTSPVPDAQEWKNILDLQHNVSAQSSCLFGATSAKASLNIPGSMANNDANNQLQGSITSFNQVVDLVKMASSLSLWTSATRNQYALFPTSSKFQAAGRPGKYGFASFSHNFLIRNRWGIPHGVGLMGGGESAANGWGSSASQTAGWGTPGANQTNPQNQWGPGNANRNSTGPNSAQSTALKTSQQSNVAQQPNSPASQQNASKSSSTTQQGPAGTTSSQQGNVQGATGNSSWAQAAGKGLPVSNGTGDAQKRQQLKNIRDALLSCDGWGGENVNQETSWDLPSSPEPAKDSAGPSWKSANNGCEVWENNLRNGGVAPMKPQVPWGHTPASNFGGTWGEDEPTDSSSMWHMTGGNNPSQWSGTGTNSAPNQPSMWGGAAKKEWNGSGGWSEHGPPRTAIENPSAPGDWPGPKSVPHVAPHPLTTPHGPPHAGPAHVAPTGPGTTSCQWNGQNKDMKPPGGGWEEPFSPPNRRDDGTAVWVNPTAQGNISRWKEMNTPIGRQAVQGPQQGRMPGPPVISVMKSDQRVWGSHGRNGTWVDHQHDGTWMDEKPGFIDQASASSWPNKPKTPTTWDDCETDMSPWPNKLQKDHIDPMLSLDDHATFQDLTNNFGQRLGHSGHQQLPLNSQLPGAAGGLQAQKLLQNLNSAVHAGCFSSQVLNENISSNARPFLAQMMRINEHIKTLQAQYQKELSHGRGNPHNLQLLTQQIQSKLQAAAELQNQFAAAQHQANFLKQQQQQQQQQQHHQQQHPPHISSHLQAGRPISQNDLFKPGLPDNFYKAFGQLSMDSDPLVQQQQQQQQHQQESRLPNWKLRVPESDEASFVKAPGPGKPNLQQTHASPTLTTLLPASNSTWSQSNRPSDSCWPDTTSDSVTGGQSGVDKVGFAMDTAQWSTVSSQNESIGLDIQPFEPGKPWTMKNIEDDPNRTVGSVMPRSSHQLNTVKNADVFNNIGKTATSSSSEINANTFGSLSFQPSTWSFSSGSLPLSNSPNSGDAKLNSAKGMSSVSAWSDGQGSSSNLTADLWGQSLKSRAPPPGMAVGNSSKLINGGTNPQSWGQLCRTTSWSSCDQRNHATSALHSSSMTSPNWPTSQSPSTWLILKNLTAQIDGSTLKTLCLQHGPLHNFHLYLNHGCALVNYGSREEAIKAQGNLNNCLLSNTTILAEFASESEVKQFLGQQSLQNNQSVVPTSSGSQSTWTSSTGGRGSTPTSQASGSKESWNSTSGSKLWGNSSSGSIWSGVNIADSDQHRATPMKTYLPEGLLTSEST